MQNPAGPCRNMRQCRCSKGCSKAPRTPRSTGRRPLTSNMPAWKLPPMMYLRGGVGEGRAAQCQSSCMHPWPPKPAKTRQNLPKPAYTPTQPSPAQRSACSRAHQTQPSPAQPSPAQPGAVPPAATGSCSYRGRRTAQTSPAIHGRAALHHPWTQPSTPQHAQRVPAGQEIRGVKGQRRRLRNTVPASGVYVFLGF
jgi:hypothetical protein